MNLQFEWDKHKAVSNLKKHKISFQESSTIFSDPLAYIFDDDEHSTPEEQREIIIGHSEKHRLLLTCFTERVANIIRIFSARLATTKERQNYEENRNF